MIVRIANAASDQSAIFKGEYIGRGAHGSPLANPYRIGKDGSRWQVIKRYRSWLRERMNAGDMKVLNELARLATILDKRGEITLVCWCSPLDCHGLVIAEVLKEVFSDESSYSAAEVKELGSVTPRLRSVDKPRRPNDVSRRFA